MSATVPDSSGAGARRALRVVAVGGGLLVGALALAYAADVLLARGELPRGAVIAGLDVGGRSRADAARLLERAAGERARRAVPLAAADARLTLDPARAGLRLDTQATLDRADRAALNPWTRLRSFFATTRTPLVAAVDADRLRAEVKRLAEQVDRAPREGAVRFEGTTPAPVLPHTGRVLDVEASAVAIARSFLQTDGPIALDVAVTPVKSTETGVRRALDEIARPAVAAPVALRAGSRTVVMPPAAVAAALRLEADTAGEIVPRLDEKQLDVALRDLLAAVEVTPRDARFGIVDDKVTITPSVVGRRVDRGALARDLLPVLPRPAPRQVELTIVDAEPRLTTEKARGLGVKEVVGEFTTHHPCCRPRVRNIHRMADIVNGAVVLPGETFSLNGYVGERDRGRGFVEAPMILNGRFVDSVGGGVSQFATTLFNAVFFSGMQDVSHKAHSYYISRYPAGREATVSFPEPDLKWRNDSSYGVVVQTAYTGTSITVRFWSTKRYDIESVSGPRTRIRGFRTVYDSRRDCTATSGAPGFDIVVWRVFKQGGKEIRRERFFTRYLPEPRFVCRRPPARPAPSASPRPSASPASGG